MTRTYKFQHVVMPNGLYSAWHLLQVDIYIYFVISNIISCQATMQMFRILV